MKNTYTTRDLMGARVEFVKKPGKRIGRVRHLVFHPTQKKVIGFAVKRPDAALMFHREDLFVALDGFEMQDGIILVKEDAESNGRSACKRLGVSWDECVIWQGLPLMTEDEQRLGYVGEITFDAQTGNLISVKVDKGASSELLLGEVQLPANLIKGFKLGIGDNLSQTSEEDFYHGAIVVDPQALQLELSGGMAEKAGAGAAVVAHKAHEAKEAVAPKATEAAQKAGEAVNKGAYKLGVQLSKTKGMFGNFKAEYQKALNGSESEKDE
jgi:sporulation protein YlmC with PRC-barrel domain